MSIVLGSIFALLGGGLWYNREVDATGSQLFDRWTLGSIGFILIGAVSIVLGMHRVLAIHAPTAIGQAAGPDSPLWTHRLYAIALIFIGSVSYTVAAYYHLNLKEWSFLKAFLIALPLILIEYQFSLRGNHYAHSLLNMNAVQIMLLTMSFYFLNAWILNRYVLRRVKVVWWRELGAFVFLAAAVILAQG